MTAHGCEIAWFAALCDDDYEFVGVPDPQLASSFEHCRDIMLAAETAGYDAILLPSGYALGIDAVALAAGIAPLTRRIRSLVAIRCGELWPPQQARRLATLDQMLGGRLLINIISSDRPGETLDNAPRYRAPLKRCVFCTPSWKAVQWRCAVSSIRCRYRRRACVPSPGGALRCVSAVYPTRPVTSPPAPRTFT